MSCVMSCVHVGELREQVCSTDWTCGDLLWWSYFLFITQATERVGGVAMERGMLGCVCYWTEGWLDVFTTGQRGCWMFVPLDRGVVGCLCQQQEARLASVRTHRHQSLICSHFRVYIAAPKTWSAQPSTQGQGCLTSPIYSWHRTGWLSCSHVSHLHGVVLTLSSPWRHLHCSVSHVLRSSNQVENGLFSSIVTAHQVNSGLFKVLLKIGEHGCRHSVLKHDSKLNIPTWLSCRTPFTLAQHFSPLQFRTHTHTIYMQCHPRVKMPWHHTHW